MKNGLDIHDGIEKLPPQDKAAANEFFDQLEQYGFFTVRRGELESWLPSLNVPGEGTGWTIGMLEKMGSDPLDPSYLRPAHDDVWEFMRKVLAWIKNPGRKGTS